MLRLTFIKVTSLLLLSGVVSAGGNELYINQIGDYTVIQIQQQGQNNIAHSDSTGNTNTSIISQTGTGNFAESVIAGPNNTVSILQDNNDKSAYVVNQPGKTGNTVAVDQTGTGSHKATVSVYSDNNSIKINQTGNTQNETSVLFSADSTGPSDFTLNQAGSNVYGNAGYVTQTCMNPSGCTVIIDQQ